MYHRYAFQYSVRNAWDELTILCRRWRIWGCKCKVMVTSHQQKTWHFGEQNKIHIGAKEG